jgi:mono/diheme cytochrome c family protein
MLTRIFALSVLFAAAGAWSVVRAQEPGDPAKGLDYAQHVCAQCHAIRKGDKFSPNRLAPGFEDIANTAGVTGISLAAILHSIHENMPNFILSVNERDNIIAYILTLKHER